MDPIYETAILFLIFNRLEVSQQVFNRIKQIRPKYLFVAADGPRTNHASDVVSCGETRKIIDQIDWPCELKTLFRDENLGCGFAVYSAISWFFEHVEAGIILEDDCLPDISFFHFCSELLARYQNDEDIYLISGTNLQNGNLRGKGSYYFSNYPITWGWASWRRAWTRFNYDIADIDRTFKSGALDQVFQNKHEKRYWKRKMKEAISKKKNIWDYQWFYAIWKNKGIGITPNVNLVTNLGVRNNSTHKFLQDSFREPKVINSIQFPLSHPPKTINYEADSFTYMNSFSHRFPRLYRLAKENGVLSIIKYSFSKFL